MWVEVKEKRKRVASERKRERVEKVVGRFIKTDRDGKQSL